MLCWCAVAGMTLHDVVSSDLFDSDTLTPTSPGLMLCHVLSLTYSAPHDWLDVPERVTFKLGLMTYRCLHGQAPRYLADHVTPALEVAPRHRLHSANRHRLIVPRC